LNAFSNKVVLITGASEGIGAELARQLSASGAKLALCARNVEKLKAVSAQCRDAISIRCDVSIESDCKSFIEQAASALGGIDILVNNAGVSGHAKFEEVTDFGWYEQMMKVNYFGSLWCTRYALPHLKARRGQLVAISSLAGKTGILGRTAYSPSKAAQALFFEALRVELLGSGVDVTIVYPGVVATDIRLHGYGPDGKALGKSMLKEEGAMTVQECARQIADAIATRKRDLVMTLQGKIGLWLKLAAPALIDRMVLRAVNK
jgi:short-subunit dehydrogenase